MEYYFEPNKCYSLCESLKKDVDLPPLYMDALSIVEVDVLKILGIHFNQKLTWNYNDWSIGYSFSPMPGCYLYSYRLSWWVWSYHCFLLWDQFCEYDTIIFMGASATHLHKLDLVQKMAERMCNTTFSSLASRHNASSIGLLWKLLHSKKNSYTDTNLDRLIQNLHHHSVLQ